MEVVVPVQDFHFDSTSTTPYVSAPSSPKQRFGDPFDLYCHYNSAPTSPTRAAAIYAHFNTISTNNSFRLSSTSSPSVIPFDWEEKPGTPKARSTTAAASDHDSADAFDFAFDFSGQLDKGGMPPALTTADELFEGGKIRPLKPPPRLQYPVTDDRSSVPSSPRSPRSPKARGVWSPLHRGKGRKGKEFDPFTAAMVEATRERGRERAPASPSFSSSRSRKGSRSLSPLRGGGGGEGFFQKSLNSTLPPAAAAAATAASSNNGLKSGGSKKWRLRDLLLFRSASEGRATGNRSKDPLRKYTLLSTSNSSSSFSLPVSNKKGLVGEDPRDSSFRSVDSSGSTRRGNQSHVSAHEMHYKVNRAVSEEMKKKTPLPYRQSLFSCLRFNPAVNSIARGFSNSFTHRRS